MDQGVSFEVYRDPMLCDTIIMVFGPLVGGRRKILKIDRQWSTDHYRPLNSHELMTLYEYLAEYRERFEEPPTVAFDHAIKTIQYLKETN